MPVYMDLHIVSPEAMLEEVMEAHKADVEIQDEYGCHCMTFWFDQSRGHAFCLIDAPSKESVKQMHNRAHGLIPHKIMEVNTNLVSAFLGRLHDPVLNDLSNSDIQSFYSDPAFRIIVATETTDLRLLVREHGKDKTMQLMELYEGIRKEEREKHHGQLIETASGGKIISFISAIEALKFSKALKDRLHIAGDFLGLGIGIHGGAPVNESEELYGDTILFSKYLALFKTSATVNCTSLIKNLISSEGDRESKQDDLFFLDSGGEKFVFNLFLNLANRANNPEFTVEDLAVEIGMSVSNLYRKSKAHLNESANHLLRFIRLQKALLYLKDEELSIANVAMESGFNNPSYFSKCFQSSFGITPAEYRSIKS